MERWSDLTVRITGGTDRNGGGDGPVVVLMHGFGAPGDDLVPLWRVLDVPREVRFVFPEAPLELPELGPYGARAWWRLDLAQLDRAAQTGQRPDRSQEVPQGLTQARQLIEELLASVERELGAERPFLGGFSQGSMVGVDVALRSQRGLSGLILLSSTLLAAHEWEPLMSARAALPIFQSHGRQDPLLPFAAAERLRDMLRNAGCDVEWVEFNGGHELPPVVLEGLGRFVRAHS